MNNHLQLCRILLLQIHGKLKPVSILSPLQRNLSRNCSCSAPLAVPCVAARSRQCLPWAWLLEPSSWWSLWPGARKVGCCAVILLWEAETWWRWLLGWDSSAWSSINESVWDRGCRGVLNLRERGGCRLRVALGHQEHKFVPFASAEAIKHTGRAIPECLPAFRWVYTEADV